MGNTKKTNIPNMTVETYPLSMEDSSYDAAFVSGIKRIVVNDAKNNDLDDITLKAIVAHEAWHMQTDASGVHDLPMSLSQHYKLRFHDEISAYLVELMQIREEYLHAKDDEARQKVEASKLSGNSDYKWYFDAIKDGKIDPFSQDARDTLAEFKFLALETQKMFFKYKDGPEYWAVRNDLTKQNFLMSDLADLAKNDENYFKALRQMYIIGGHDFAHDIIANGKDVDGYVPDYYVAADQKIADACSSGKIKSDVDEDKIRQEIEADIGIELSSKNRESYAKLRKMKNGIDKEKKAEKLAKKVLGRNINHSRQYQISDFKTMALEHNILRNFLDQGNMPNFAFELKEQEERQRLDDAIERYVRYSDVAQEGLKQKIEENQVAKNDTPDLVTDNSTKIYLSKEKNGRN